MKTMIDTERVGNLLRFALGLFLLFAGVGHLSWARTEFVAQVPTWLPVNSDLVVLVSGVMEIALGTGLVVLNQYRVPVGWATALFFVLVFPGNISQYLNGVDAFGLDTDRARLVRLFFQPLLILWALYSTGAWKAWRNANKDRGNFYNFSAVSLQGKEIPMGEYEGKLILVVNTASQCGLTPQFKGLEELYQKYRERGLVILGFPCNQFANQEPGDEKSIASGCLINYGVTFPMFSKIKVNGKGTNPIYHFLKRSKGGLLNDSIKWNFTKFLIDTRGIPIKRFGPIIQPSALEAEIEANLPGNRN